MSKEVVLPTRDEAAKAGLPVYGRSEEVFVAESDDFELSPELQALIEKYKVIPKQPGELIGTQVSIRNVETDAIVIATTIERDRFRTEKGYNRAIKKTMGSTARSIGSLLAASAISS